MCVQDGLFLVRESTNFPGDYTLCVCYKSKVEHYRVIYKDNKLTIDEEEFFENLSQLVEVRGSLLYHLLAVLIRVCLFSAVTVCRRCCCVSIIKRTRTGCARD